MHTPGKTKPLTLTENNWSILVNSIGSAGSGLVKALKQISPLSENKIAALLYQAPARLISDLPKQSAEEMTALLRSAGLDCQVIASNSKVELGDASHEIALVIKDVARMKEIAQLIVQLLGVTIQEVRQILFTTPTVLLGKISKNTAYIIRERFKALNVEVDISKSKEASFDVFLGDCSELEQQRLRNIFKEKGLSFVNPTNLPAHNSIVCTGLSKSIAETLWAKTSRTNLPLRIINRDFERFDLRLESIPKTADAINYLIESTGMPQKIAHKALEHLPITLHQNISFKELERHIHQITELGGKAIGHLLVFQTFSLQIESVRDPKSSIDILKALSRKKETDIVKVIQGKNVLEGPFTNLQAKWIQYELKQIGTIVKRILR